MDSKLYYNNLLIGIITNTISDFPNLGGTFQSLLKPTNPLSIQIIDYINFSKDLSEFYLNQNNLHTRNQNILLNKEKEFKNLINSSKWRLINSNGEETEILIPTFDNEDKISYRYNF